MGRKSATATSTTGPSPRRRKSVAKKTSVLEERHIWDSTARSFLEFVAVTACSLGLSTLLFSLSVPITQGDLAWTSKHLDSWVYVAALLGWRVLEIGTAWALGYDARDITSFVGLINLPTYVLLYSFYGLRPTTILTVAAINTISTTLPFFYFRRTNRIHSLTTSFERPVLTDRPTAIYTSLVSAAIYTVALYLSFATWLPTFLVTHFEGLPSIQAAYEGAKGLIPMFVSLLPAGYAARDFLFVSSIGQPHAEDEGPEYVKRQGELFVTSLHRKHWAPLPAKRKTLTARTISLAAMTFANTVVQLVGTINGVGIEGAVGWALIWTAANLANGMVYGWIDAGDALDIDSRASRR
ncbi:predicted protein [Uncinocarpus reesii 1704]|uniref:Uncharacterized protein n=1 Tax=Uncinocarpus reesii (strain UAMH 1704) TaxID=336963 RepID=C4JZC0_UNCRE|nr:uncharacterized protein UREG_07521 [Uncinocarpus reesii 1704]EEP82656.1 predicted protein [Uncinocarpus reesii 1704]